MDSVTLILQGIGPTLIAFRVANEPPRTEVNKTSEASPLSRLTFRRTARHSDIDSQTPSAWGSTGGEHLSSDLIHMGVDVQAISFTEQESQESMEKREHIRIGAESV